MDPSVIASVAAGAAQDAGGVDVTLLDGFLPSVVDAASSGRRLRRSELESCSERGAAAALVGVPLRALIDLYLSACWRLWLELPAVTTGDAATVRAAGLAVLRAADDGVAALAEGFQLARNEVSRRQESARREVFDALLAGGPDASDVLGRAADLGLDLTSPHAVLVARHERTFDDPGTAALPSRVERSLQGRLGDAAPLVAVKLGELVCIVAAPDAAAVAEVSRRVESALGAEPSRGTPGRRAWQAALGGALPGARSVRVSYERAVDTLDLAARLELDTAVVDAGDLVIYRVLLRDRAAVHELITTVLAPLTSARGGAEVLLETLDAYYAVGGVATEAARRLHLSVRALTYRLERVREAIGQDPTDPANRFTLHAAVLAARLLHWPRVPLPSSSGPG